ncbi:MAG: UTP--glucose-1-phosphate uridylyltransferase [Candidatus Komeilibacteria bacterium RIFCSPLOWO2_01_FULL_52_15]|uniref:UTP--glucose-1-phosphate uridylyltransferase n=2 Tax=Candidatus Komeiliibacteriota TaxID=1817908 RepID=A0A1G2BSX2_9BACT|nr:MAG: UTP--glucose-1-phosphate uridylyltransferase [Candidatus Komeilibacteria bacterium RIFCSPHIGHO2_01_FULL_52_14]OGY92088.1 MAG: UTP--glucose-1-phosphate uridylyltransferase [Candidatus Komeilibacteria bacterium RIFCSPLOWO2_01_FULL_52_15]
MLKIKKAIIPVAGLGTRFLPATKATPKEMLPIVDKPVVQYLVEEAVASGITDIIFVTGRGKRAIEDHFDISYELEDTLVERNKRDLLHAVRKIPSLARFAYVRQSRPLGDGHALLQARHLIGNEPVLVMFGDCLYDSAVPAARQLIDAFYECGSSVIGLSRVPRNQISKFGIIGGARHARGMVRVTQLIEKPKASKAPSNLAAVGKYVITPDVFKELATLSHASGGEIRLIDAFSKMLSRKHAIYGKILEGTWLDTGDKLNFIRATLHFGLQHEEIRTGLKQLLKKYR